MAYNANTDYQALIDKANASGNSAAAAQYEAQRNEKIAAMNAAGTNTNGYTATNNYDSNGYIYRRNTVSPTDYSSGYNKAENADGGTYTDSKGNTYNNYVDWMANSAGVSRDTALNVKAQMGSNNLASDYLAALRAEKSNQDTQNSTLNRLNDFYLDWSKHQSDPQSAFYNMPFEDAYVLNESYTTDNNRLDNLRKAAASAQNSGTLYSDYIKQLTGNGANATGALSGATNAQSAVNANTNQAIYDRILANSSGNKSGGSASGGSASGSNGGNYGSGSSSGSGSGGLTSATSQEDYINSMYSAAQEKALAALKTAYDNNTATVDAQAAKIPGIYHASENAVAADNAQQTQNMNEYFAANGLNNGAAGQAQLSQNNVYQKNIGSLEEAKATALNDVETQRTQLSTQYQNAIAEAIANNNYEQATALYNEAVRVDESIVSTALNQANLNYQYSTLNQNQAQFNTNNQISAADNLAQYGDFSGYKALGYSDGQISNMTAAYKAAAAAAAAKKSGSGGGGGDYKTGNSNFSAIDAYVNGGGDSDDYIGLHYKDMGFSNVSQAKAAYNVYLQGKSSTGTTSAAGSQNLYNGIVAMINTPSRLTEKLDDGSSLIPSRIAAMKEKRAITEAQAVELLQKYYAAGGK